ncbi:MAG: hypothetical protein GWO20_03455 [Candidatus Korarchaeota archaeon]|nr:hypothetical protein [Candidatus Korarchaeota archaeon]NIU81930.1 hypothetical protein [Candidatus Thorarchaeota archaeon]NIW12388.1 hypothetical protein [Candidatus Thorarchaeota archaeon]
MPFNYQIKRSTSQAHPLTKLIEEGAMYVTNSQYAQKMEVPVKPKETYENITELCSEGVTSPNVYSEPFYLSSVLVTHGKNFYTKSLNLPIFLLY